MAKMEHTLHSVGETVERHYKEFRAFAGKAESKADEGLEWWKQSHWSALIGLVLAARRDGGRRHPRDREYRLMAVFGGVPEWSNGSVLKTVGLRELARGFESHPLLQR